MAASYAVYNIILLLTRFSNTLQAPLLSKNIETAITLNQSPSNSLFFGLVLISFLGASAGIILIPFTIRIMLEAVEKVHNHNSILSLFKQFNLIRIKGYLLSSFRETVFGEVFTNLSFKGMSPFLLFSNFLISGMVCTSVLACLYAGFLNPSLRATCLSLNGFIIGGSTILSMLITEPHLGILADKVAYYNYDKQYFMRYIKLVIIARVLGTLVGFFILIPMAHLVLFLAEEVF